MGSPLPLKEVDHTPGKSDISSHAVGTQKGEEWVKDYGREPGRHEDPPHRTARDATSVNPTGRKPILPSMPHLPPQ